MSHYASLEKLYYGMISKNKKSNKMEETLKILKLIGREKLTSVAKTATIQMFKDYPVETDAKDVISEKAQTVIDIINTNKFGCQKEAVAKLCEALLGEEVVKHLKEDSDTNDCDFPAVLYACFTLKMVIGGYKTGGVWLVVSEDNRCLTLEDLEEKGVGGVSTDDMDFGDEVLNAVKIRPSTEGEIDSYMEVLFHHLEEVKE